ncbi:hypothetical protein [Woeseia oceani]|uniref:Uncharacterized protein n=1 Tax=Woeseia oceani TaxID=1548547 RepID=A0A193LF19_9GAMM|nr:hypothetical protein [Woeseia oceani]ANO51063.1 hypothetical protein BA177_07435 [Woeseia oceani]
MADNGISGLYRILPAYSVKPPQPVGKEGEQERREQSKRPDEDVTDTQEEKQRPEDGDDNSVIDEYV